MSKVVTGDFEKVMDKVQKLLARTEEAGCTPEEAGQALAIAHKLIAQHNLDMSQVEGGPPPRKMIIQRTQHRYNDSYRANLARAVADNFCVKHFYTGQTIMFYGYEEDVEVAVAVFNAAYEFIYQNGWREHNRRYKEGLPTRGVVGTYALGFIRGLKATWDEQSVALMVVTPPEVTEGFEHMSEGWKSTKKRVTPNGDSELMQRGYRDGKEFASVKKLEE